MLAPFARLLAERHLPTAFPTIGRHNGRLWGAVRADCCDNTKAVLPHEAYKLAGFHAAYIARSCTHVPGPLRCPYLEGRTAGMRRSNRGSTVVKAEVAPTALGERIILDGFLPPDTLGIGDRLAEEGEFLRAVASLVDHSG